MTSPGDMMQSANRLAKWRQVFAGWQLGTRKLGDPEADAVRDHREVTILLRAEVNALTRLLVESGVVSQERLLEVMTEEYNVLNKLYEEKFPGISANNIGIKYTAEAAKTMKGWLP